MQKIGWLKFMGVALVGLYIGYLHYKVVVYKRMFADRIVVDLHGAIVAMEGQAKGDRTIPVKLAEKQIVSAWEQFDSGALAVHPGKIFWRSYILKILSLYGTEPASYPASLQSELKRGHFVLIPGPEFYESWNYPMIEWWP